MHARTEACTRTGLLKKVSVELGLMDARRTLERSKWGSAGRVKRCWMTQSRPVAFEYVTLLLIWVCLGLLIVLLAWMCCSLCAQHDMSGVNPTETIVHCVIHTSRLL